jgi:hypothetical protein
MGNSTGPRTPRGKARSSQNAAKHWIESRRILPEEQKEAAILRGGFEEDFKPLGLIEHEVIDDLVFNRLNKRRIDVVYTREFSKATIEKTITLLENDERSVAQYWLQSADLLGKYRTEHERVERLRPDTCIAALEGLKTRIGARGPQPGDLELLRSYYGEQPTEHAALVMLLLAPVASQQTVPEIKSQNSGQEELKKEVLDALQIEIERQKFREELASALLTIESDSNIQEPPRHTLETLQRYRAANTREFNSLLDGLERIRRLRRSAA